MNQELDQAVSDIRNQPVDDAVVEAASARVWARISAAPEAQAMSPLHDHISDCAAFQSLIPDLRASRLSGPRATLLQDHLHECVACRRVYEGRVVTLPAAVIS